MKKYIYISENVIPLYSWKTFSPVPGLHVDFYKMLTHVSWPLYFPRGCDIHLNWYSFLPHVSFFLGYFQDFFFFCLVFSILSIIILAFCFHQCVYFCLFICLHGFFFIYILLGVCSAFQICKFISFTQFWNFFPNNFLSYSLSFSSVTLM